MHHSVNSGATEKFAYNRFFGRDKYLHSSSKGEESAGDDEIPEIPRHACGEFHPNVWIGTAETQSTTCEILGPNATRTTQPPTPGRVSFIAHELSSSSSGLATIQRSEIFEPGG